MNPDLYKEHRENLLSGATDFDPLGYLRYQKQCDALNRQLIQKENNDVNKTKSRNNSTADYQ